MKLALRVFALTVAVAGLAAAMSSATTHAIASRQTATSALPVPQCGPHIPTCPPDGK